MNWISPSIADKVGPDLNDSDDFVLPPGPGPNIGSFTFVEQVKNATANQTHKVQMQAACMSLNGGCYVEMPGPTYTRVATMRIDVFTGCYVNRLP